jgi:hypothetical protein
LETVVKPCHVKLISILSGALVALPALAQPQASPPTRSSAESTPAKATVVAPKVLTAAANAKASTPLAALAVTAAGSVIILSDGIVANAAMAQIQPPAPGFVYER